MPDAAKLDTSRLAACVSGAIEESQYLDQLRSAGFSDVRVVDRSLFAPVAGSSVKTWSVRVESRKSARSRLRRRLVN